MTFTCKVEKRKTSLIYQWFKNGVGILGQNDSTLVLNNVGLRDFGLYMCRVTDLEDSLFGEPEESKYATLDVIPRDEKSECFDVHRAV